MDAKLGDKKRVGVEEHHNGQWGVGMGVQKIKFAVVDVKAMDRGVWYTICKFALCLNACTAMPRSEVPNCCFGC